MCAPYSIDLRWRVVDTFHTGCSTRDTGATFVVGPSTVSRWNATLRDTGTLMPKKCGGSISPLEKHQDVIFEMLESAPDLTLREMVLYLKAKHIKTSKSSVGRFFERHEITLKKKTVYASEQRREDVVLARKKWKKSQPKRDASNMVFVDETSVNTAMARTHGRAKRGKRVFDFAPNGHRKSFTLVAGLTTKGIVAPIIVDGALNGEGFLAYASGPLSKSIKKGQTVVMDNCATHKVAGVREAIQKRGATLEFVPPYSPDLNPIEMVFGKLKGELRRAEERTVDALTEKVGTVLKKIEPPECKRFVRHAGYVPI